MVLDRENAIYSQKKITLFLKKKEKESNIGFIVGIGAKEARQMDRRGEAQKTQLYYFV